jgi:spermidine synthase
MTGPLLFRLFSSLPLLLGVLLCTTFLLLPPILMLGSTTPLLIQGIAQDVAHSGRVSGNVYAISTSGGILTTFSFGFFVIPELGISQPSVFAAAFILLMANLLLHKIKPLPRVGISAAILLPVLLLIFPPEQDSKTMEVIFEQEGVLGQVKVVDVDAIGNVPKTRRLLFNGIPQTSMLKGDYSATSYFRYVHLIAMLAGMKPPGSEALICGLGAGSLVMEYDRLGFKTDVVDIDWRLPALGERYFYLDPSAYTFYVDDARHFISEAPKQYDLITLDIIFAEAQPYHLYTVEAFREFKKKLKPDGLLITNFQGRFFGSEGIAERSIFKTMQAAGFEVFVVPSVGEGIQDIIYVASPTHVPFENLNLRRLSPCCISIAHADVFVQDPRRHVVSNPDLDSTYLLIDDRPMLDLIRLPSVMEYRRNKINSLIEKDNEDQLYE